MDKSTIIILGDIVPTDANYSSFISGDSHFLFNDIRDYLIESDLAICNLETPLTSSTNKIHKSGPHLSAPPDCVKAICDAGINVVGLSNNHIRDYGEIGIHDTLNACLQQGIIPVGVGDNIDRAKTPCYITLNDVVVGVLAICDKECSTANENRTGAYGYDELETMDWIHSCKENCDYLIVLFHSGLEHYQYPSPFLQKKCRKMVEKGANLVVCQHSHCIGAAEKYLDGEILYGQGNSLFYRSEKSRMWNTGLMIKISLANGESNVEYIPTIMHDGTVATADKEYSQLVLNEFECRSNSIKSSSTVQDIWTEWNKKREALYYSILLGFGKYLTKINMLMGNKLGRLLIPDKKKVVISNVVRCESHSESLLQVLADKYG